MIIGTFSGPPSPYGGSSSANEYSTIQELLYKMPDNTANLIQAKDVRDSVYTLWERISDVQVVASQSASASVLYTNLTTTPTTIGGIAKGSTFSNKSMKEMWDLLLYPYVGPTSSLSPNVIREFGDSNSITLNYNVTKNSSTITSIIIDRIPSGYSYVVPGAPFTSNVSGSDAATAITNVNATFSVTVDDGTSTSVSNVTFTWLNAIYWGKTSTFALPSMSIFGTQPAWADGASFGLGKELSSTKAKTYTNLDGNGQYLVFAWPYTFGEPTFTVNGLFNNSFTKIGASVSHTNMYTYTTGYDVWISNTPQYAPITSLIIS
jgi:hypothetical protein